MDLVKFQPIRVSEDVVSRPLVSELLQDRTSLTVLNAPSGFGKSVLAAQLYERWSGDRLWINVSKWANIDNDLCSFLVDIAQRIAPDWSLNDERVNHTELACRFVELLNNRQHPMLLVFDDIDRKFELNFLNALLANADFIATGHKVIVCSRSFEIGIHQYKTNAHSYRLLNAELLRFTEADVKQRFPEKAENSVLTRLVNECEGWPALVGIVGRECLYGTTETEILSMLGDFARESIEHFLPQPVGECAVALSDIEEFDDSLFQALDESTGHIIQGLVRAGFIIKSKRLMLSIHYRWPTIVHKVLQDPNLNLKPNNFIWLRLLAWADSKKRWSDSLFMALKLDDTAQIRKRLILTGQHIQETGHARLLRQALYFVKQDQGLPLQDRMAMLLIDLAAHCMQPRALLARKIDQSYQHIQTLPEAAQQTYLVWVKCVDAQFALRIVDIDRGKKLVSDIQDKIGLLPVYYQVKALSVLGEVAIEDGCLDRALHYFEQGAELALAEELISSLLWHRHQQAQVQSLAGQSSVAEHIRFSAIQLARENKGTDLFPYICLVRAHCENLLSELRIYEAEPYIEELERHVLHRSDDEALAVNLLRLECHRLTCLLDNDYQNDIHQTVAAVERALLNSHHPHIAVRAQRSLLNYWYQSEQIYRIGQWYQRQSFTDARITSPDRLLHLRNVLYAFLILKFYDYNEAPIWPNYTETEVNEWLSKWPSLAPSPMYLLVLATEKMAPQFFLTQLSKAMGCFSQTNALAEPLSYHPSWLEPLYRGDVPLHRYQATFISRLNAIRGNRVKHRIVRDGETQTSSVAHIGLSPREWQMLQCVAKGQTNETIADILNLSVGTVKNQLTKIYRKLGVTSRGAARSRFKSLAETA